MVLKRVFSALHTRPDLTKTLVLCGGIGHSTPFLYEAIARNAKYQILIDEVKGLPEARVLYKIFTKFFDGDGITKRGCKVLVEDRSTNCGANASETRKLLERHEILMPESIAIVQDPTMSLRTVASFDNAFSGVERIPHIVGLPTFVPQMELRSDGALAYASTTGVAAEGLWDVKRFCDLILGEIPRLRDDESGYGPRGKGFITHVDVPEEVEKAWSRSLKAFGDGDRTKVKPH